MRLLIKSGADVNVEDEDGVCQLLFAARCISPENGTTSRLLRYYWRQVQM
jgi:hypothetical protein